MTTPKTTILVAGNGPDFWILLHQPGKCEILNFCHGGEAGAYSAAAVAETAAKFFGAETELREIEPELELEIDETGGQASVGWKLRSKTGKTYTGETETECLRELIKSEPDAILEA